MAGGSSALERKVGGYDLKSEHNLANEYHFLQLNAQLEPLTGNLSVSGNIDFYARQETATLEILLHRDLKITGLHGDNIDSYACENGKPPAPWLAEAAILKIKLKHPVSQGDRVSFAINYGGRIGIVSEWETNRISPEWVELGLYAPWFPLPAGNELFTYELAMTMNPPEYGFVSSGEGRKGAAEEYRDGHTRWIVRSTQPVSDIVLLAAPRIYSKSSGSDGRIEVFYTDPGHESIASIILEASEKLVAHYMKQYQYQESDMDGYFKIMLAPRSVGGGYVRPGLMVLSEVSETDYHKHEKAYAHWFAHEIAHLWWFRAPSYCWEDWLNESFAEYAAVMAMRDFYGADVFESILTKKRDKTANTPCIMGIERNNEAAVEVLYDKGPLVLHELETRMELRRKGLFVDFLRAALKDKIVSTAQLLDLLAAMAGPEDAKWLEDRLKE